MEAQSNLTTAPSPALWPTSSPSLESRFFWSLLSFVALLPVVIYLYCDFQNFLSLGPGGTPSTPAGYIKVKMLGLLAIQDPYTMDPSLNYDSKGHLADLPDRGPRPRTQGIAPHRQMTQRANQALYQKLAKAVDELGKTSPDLTTGTSCFEKHSTGLYSTSPLKLTCQGEICHVHPIDGSMHLTLHPADAKKVLDSRWGERHPLARGDSLALFVPETFMMVYSPHHDDDIEILMQIIKAAAWYIGTSGVIEEGSLGAEAVQEEQ